MIIFYFYQLPRGCRIVVVVVVVVVVIFRIVTDIQQINTYLVGYNSWSFHLSIIAVTYHLNKIKQALRYIGDGSQLT